jgi:mevalonate kinase
MPAITATAPGKVILFGEHAVVYGRPAIAAPVQQVQARAVIAAAPLRPAGEVLIDAPDIGLHSLLSELANIHPLAIAMRGVMDELGLERLPACDVRITSTIPLAAGLGSGAAISVALIRALAQFLGHPLPDERVSALAFEVEKLYHGTPSGIDNTVVTYNCPVYFVKDQVLETIQPLAPFDLAIGDTGVKSPTALTVGDLRRLWQVDKRTYEAIFDEVAEITQLARQAIESGHPEHLGTLMDANQACLERMGVSSPDLERLIAAARLAGAAGAKLSGGGRGGNMIALVGATSAQVVAKALVENGAQRVILTTVRKSF